MSQRKSRPAYSTGPQGPLPMGIRACSRCGHWPCRCEPQKSEEPRRQSPRIRRETAGRGGKTVTTIQPLLLARADAQALLADLKKLCGSGGTLKAEQGPQGAFFIVEVQGDHADKCVAEMIRRGYQAKRAGG